MSTETRILLTEESQLGCRRVRGSGQNGRPSFPVSRSAEPGLNKGRNLGLWLPELACIYTHPIWGQLKGGDVPQTTQRVTEQPGRVNGLGDSTGSANCRGEESP